MTEGTERIELEGLAVTVEDAGEGLQPWVRGGRAYRYRVTVTDGATTYETDAHGSQVTYRGGPGTHGRWPKAEERKSIGWMVLGELLSAAYDPDEFWEMAIGDERPTREFYERVEAEIVAAEKLLPALERHADIINNEGEAPEPDRCPECGDVPGAPGCSTEPTEAQRAYHAEMAEEGGH